MKILTLYQFIIFQRCFILFISIIWSLIHFLNSLIEWTWIDDWYLFIMFIRIFHDIISVNILPMTIELYIVNFSEVILCTRFQQLYKFIRHQEIDSVLLGRWLESFRCLDFTRQIRAVNFVFRPECSFLGFTRVQSEAQFGFKLIFFIVSLG